ncbi:MAG: hypothetical protein SFX19_01355 [Alphaproteobacteria bacterium]|nr:hypothetical protein [Alphaproteobacteria bacterium]
MTENKATFQITAIAANHLRVTHNNETPHIEVAIDGMDVRGFSKVIPHVMTDPKRIWSARNDGKSIRLDVRFMDAADVKHFVGAAARELDAEAQTIVAECRTACDEFTQGQVAR